MIQHCYFEVSGEEGFRVLNEPGLDSHGALAIRAGDPSMGFAVAISGPDRQEAWFFADLFDAVGRFRDLAHAELGANQQVQRAINAFVAGSDALVEVMDCAPEDFWIGSTAIGMARRAA